MARKEAQLMERCNQVCTRHNIDPNCPKHGRVLQCSDCQDDPECHMPEVCAENTWENEGGQR